MTSENNKSVLSDIGEFKLLNNYIVPLLQTSSKVIGDDCAHIKFPRNATQLIITTDAGPKPIFHTEKYPFYYIWGWYTVLANVSDLASAGCYPLALSLAIEADPQMLTSELMDFFKGVKAAAKKFKIDISGGNIKSNTKFVSNATAIGYLKKGQKTITRRKCKPDDIVISLGDNGKYIVAYLKFLQGGYSSLDKSEQEKIRGPLPQLEQMQALNNGLYITASSDNSDGILGSLWNIAEKSKCGFELDFDNIKFPKSLTEFADKYDIDPVNLFLFWGDWQVIFTLNPKDWKKFQSISKKHGIQYAVLGKAIKGNPGLYGRRNGNLRTLNLIRNENFTKLSYNSEIKNHIDYMLKQQIFKN